MNKVLMIVCCTVLCGCASGKGTVEQVGRITVEGYQFSYCNRAKAMIEQQKNGRILLCGYTIEELMEMHGANYTDLSFNGEAE